MFFALNIELVFFFHHMGMGHCVTVLYCSSLKGHMSENWGYFLLAEAKKNIHWNPISSNIQFLNHTETYIKILKIQTYHNEHGWKYLQVSYMKSYHHHRFHICLSLPWNSKHDHSLLATKNIMLYHSAQWKTVKTHNASFPLPKNIFIYCIYLIFLGSSWKAYLHFSIQYSSGLYILSTTNSLNIPRTVQSYLEVFKDFV